MDSYVLIRLKLVTIHKYNIHLHDTHKTPTHSQVQHQNQKNKFLINTWDHHKTNEINRLVNGCASLWPKKD